MDKTEQLTRAHRLGELIDGFPERVPGALPALQEMLDNAADDEVLAAAIDATGLASGHQGALALLIGRGLDGHASNQVRSAFARALATVPPDGELAEPATAALCRLSADSEDEIRDWSCYALGQLGVDGPAVREALVARIADESPAARSEALVALARLGDVRVVPVLRRRFETDDPFDIEFLELTAAAAIADPALLAGLLRIDAAWQDEGPVAAGDPADDDPADDESELFDELEAAIAACRAAA